MAVKPNVEVVLEGYHDDVKQFQIAMSYALGGFQDYLASRVLLERKMLIQAATLSCTAVEKFLKCNFTVRNKKLRGHLNDWNGKKLSDIAEYYGLNQSFLKLLQIIYRVRYIDSLDKNLSFSIERLKFLAELDCTIFKLSNSAKIYQDGQLKSPFQTAVEAGNEFLIKDNWILSKLDKIKFVKQPDIATAFYINTDLSTYSCVINNYVTNNLSSFSEPGIIAEGKNLKCILGGTL